MEAVCYSIITWFLRTTLHNLLAVCSSYSKTKRDIDMPRLVDYIANH